MCFCAFSQPGTFLCQKGDGPTTVSGTTNTLLLYPDSLLFLNAEVQTRRLCVFTHTPEWTSASFLELDKILF